MNYMIFRIGDTDPITFCVTGFGGVRFFILVLDVIILFLYYYVFFHMMIASFTDIYMSMATPFELHSQTS